MNKISFSSRGTRLKETKSRSRLESQIRHLVNVCNTITITIITIVTIITIITTTFSSTSLSPPLLCGKISQYLVVCSPGHYQVFRKREHQVFQIHIRYFLFGCYKCWDEISKVAPRGTLLANLRTFMALQTNIWEI